MLYSNQRMQWTAWECSIIYDWIVPHIYQKLDMKPSINNTSRGISRVLPTVSILYFTSNSQQIPRWDLPHIAKPVITTRVTYNKGQQVCHLVVLISNKKRGIYRGMDLVRGFSSLCIISGCIETNRNNWWLEWLAAYICGTSSYDTIRFFMPTTLIKPTQVCHTSALYTLYIYRTWLIIIQTGDDW